MLIVPEFKIWPYEPIVVGQGCHGAVMRISDNLVAKLFFATSNQAAEEFAEGEFSIAKALYDYGVSVPKPEGVFRLKEGVRSFSEVDPAMAKTIPSEAYSFVMEFVPGSMLDSEVYKSEPEYWSHLYKKADKETRKANKIAIPFDDGPNNILVHENQSDVFLIDFRGWKLKQIRNS